MERGGSTRVRRLFSVDRDTVPALGILLEHRDAVLLVVIDESAIPVLERRKEGISAVLLVAFVRPEGNVRSEVLEVLLIEALKAFLVEVVPLGQILETGAFVLDDQMGVSGAE